MLFAAKTLRDMKAVLLLSVMVKLSTHCLCRLQPDVYPSSARSDGTHESVK
jgi:hypothetical protein